MALKYLESIVILFLQILMSLLNLLIHGVISEDQRPSLFNNNSHAADDNDAKETNERNNNITGFELASLLQKWTAHHRNNVNNTTEEKYTAQALRANSDEKCKLKKLQIQNTSREFDNSLLKNSKCNNASRDSSANVEKITRLNITKLVTKECYATEIHKDGEQITFDKSLDICEGKNKVSTSAKKYLDRTNLILSKIDKCLSTSKKRPLQNDLFLTYQNKTVQPNLKRNQQMTKPGDNLADWQKVPCILSSADKAAVQETVNALKTELITHSEKDIAAKPAKNTDKCKNDRSLYEPNRQDGTNISRVHIGNKSPSGNHEIKNEMNQNESTNCKDQLEPRNDAGANLSEADLRLYAYNKENEARAPDIQLSDQTEHAPGIADTEISNPPTDFDGATSVTYEQYPNNKINDIGILNTEQTPGPKEESGSFSLANAHRNPSMANTADDRSVHGANAVEFLKSLHGTNANFTETNNQGDQNTTSTAYFEDDAIVAISTGGAGGCQRSVATDPIISVAAIVHKHAKRGEQDRTVFDLGADVENHAERRTEAGNDLSDADMTAVLPKRIKHRWRKYGNPNENPSLVRDRMYAVRRRQRRAQFP